MPKRVIYKIISKLRMKVPIWMAKLLAITESPKWSQIVSVKTYDGSGQACHPSVTCWKNRFFLACTPYPYEIEYYENPSLWEWKGNNWQPVKGVSPIVEPQKRGFEHYSDPCLFVKDEELYLLFRKCERYDEGKIDILFLTKSKDGIVWEKEQEIIRGKGNHLISPGIANERNKLFVVEYYDCCNTSLISYELTDGFCISKKRKCNIQGLDEEYFVWHIDVRARNDERLEGLFMLKNKSNPDEDSKLALFELRENVWIHNYDILLNEEEQMNVRYVYKSCFDVSDNTIICSAIDKKGRFILFRKVIGGKDD